MEQKKTTIWHALICVVLVCLIWGGYFLMIHRHHQDLKIGAEDSRWIFQVDSLAEDGNRYTLKGFSFYLGKNSVEKEFEIVLQDIKTRRFYFPKMRYVDRLDVNEYFKCNYDFVHSGFEADIKFSDTKLSENDYEIFVRKTGEKQIYSTGTYVSKGKLMYTNPEEYEPLSVEGTALETIVNEGILRMYRPDCGMYVYQYKGELYWIADEKYMFDESGDAYIQYQLNTTQTERLPEERIKNQWYWDNIPFSFVANEIVGIDTGKYRVAKKKIPTAYSVEKISTGLFEDKWIWMDEFRPYYVFQ